MKHARKLIEPRVHRGQDDMNPGEIQRLASAFEHSTIGMALQSPEGRWIEVNPAFCEMLGYSREELLRKSFTEITHPEDVERSVHQLRRLNRGELSSFRFDKRYVRADAREVWVRLDVSMVLDEKDRPDFIITQAQDITTSRQIRQQLADSEERLRSIIRTLAEGLIVYDADGCVTMGNEQAAQILGFSDSAELEGRRIGLQPGCIRPDGSPMPIDEYPVAVSLRTGRSQRDVLLGFVHSDGRTVWIEASTEPVFHDETGALSAVVATFSDVTPRLSTEQALKNSEERLSLALEGAKLGMWDWFPVTGLVNFSRIASDMLGYDDGDVAPTMTAVRALAHVDDEQEFTDSMQAHLTGARPNFDLDLRMRRKSGGYVWTNLRGRVTQRDADERPLRVTGTLMDISERKKLEFRLVELATTDGLTGLSNRRHGTDALGRAVAQAQRSGQTLSFVLLDIDHFKQVNDRFGHEVGDRVLVELAELLKTRVRRSDIVARWGGEEFAVILPGSKLSGGKAFSDQMLENMGGIRTPDGAGLTGSFGVVTLRDGETALELVKRADRLMYRAKHSGRARVEVEDEGKDA